MKRGRFGNGKCGVLKLDISKAFNRVEWKFVEEVLSKLGYTPSVIELIMRCVQLVRFSFVLNGENKGFIMPSRGLNQGDPLSPFLFLICSEGLSALLRQAENAEKFRGLRFGNPEFNVSRHFFADDSLIFFRATEEDERAMLICLNKYAHASGQLINYDKSEIGFGRKLKEHVRALLARSLGVKLIIGHNKYLGLHLSWEGVKPRSLPKSGSEFGTR